MKNKILNPTQDAAERSGQPEDADIDMSLNNEDFIFKEVRNISLSALGGVTTRKLNEIQAIVNRKDEKMSIKEMTAYMAEVKELNIAKSKQLIDWHVNIAMEIKKRQKTVDYSQCFQLEVMII